MAGNIDLAAEFDPPDTTAAPAAPAVQEAPERADLTQEFDPPPREEEHAVINDAAEKAHQWKRATPTERLGMMASWFPKHFTEESAKTLSKNWEDMNTPMIDLPQVDQNSPEMRVAGVTDRRLPIMAAIYNGLAPVASGLTTPLNLGTLGAFGALTKVAQGFGPAAKAASVALNTLKVYFGAEMAAGAGGAAGQASVSVTNPNASTEEAITDVTSALAQAGLAALAGYSAVEGLTPKKGAPVAEPAPKEPAAAVPAAEPAAKPPGVAEVVSNFDAEGFRAWAKDQPEGITTTAHKVGVDAIGNAEAITTLKAAQEAAAAEYQATLKKFADGDDAAGDAASSMAAKAQFFREAVEAAENTGSAKTAPAVEQAHTAELLKGENFENAWREQGGQGGAENQVVFRDGRVFKRNYNNSMGVAYPNHGSLAGLKEHIELHNQIFPETALKLEGMSETSDGPAAVFSQAEVKGVPATVQEIRAFMEQKGFEPYSANAFENKAAGIRVADMTPANVVMGFDGKIHVIDPMIKRVEATKPVDLAAEMEAPIEVGLGAAAASEFKPSASVTSTKNVMVDQERVARGLRPAMQQAARDFGTVWDDAMKIMDESPEQADALVNELRTSPRAVTDTENAILLHRQIELQNSFDRIAKRVNSGTGSPVTLAADQAELGRLSGELLDLYDAGKAAGRETGRGLNARKMLANEDFTLANMVTRRRAMRGGEELTPEEITEVTEQHNRIQKATKAIDEAEGAKEQKAAGDALDKAMIEATKPDAGPAVDLPAAREEIIAGLKKAAADDPDLAGLRNYVRKLAENFVREGVKDREQLIDAVHGVLKDVLPEVTRRQTMDAISGYGDFKPLDQDAIKAELRDLRGQMQQVGKLEDMQGGKAPAKTGVERRIPSDEERRLIKQVEEAKRKGGFTVTDPARQLRSALESIKTRLRNSIKDLEYQIATKAKIVREKTDAPRDAEVDALKAERDKLKDEFDQIFTKPELTDKQRIAIAEKAADRQIAELERQLRTNELFPGGPKAAVTSAALEAKRARIDALKEEREFARHTIQPKPEPKTAEEIRAVALDKQIAELERQIKNEEVFPKGKKAPETHSPENQAKIDRVNELKAERENIREKLQPSADLPFPDELALRSFKLRTANKIAELRERLEKGDFSKREPVEFVKDSEAAKLQAELDAAKESYKNALEIDRYNQLSALGKFKEQSTGFYDLARLMMTTGELSFILRQGKVGALSRPIMTAKAFPEMVRAFMASPEVARQINLELLQHPDMPAAREAKLHILERGQSLSKMEEAFMMKFSGDSPIMAQRVAGKIPLIGRFNQAGEAFLNKLRFDMWQAMRGTGGLTGAENAQVARFVNQATGRGTLGSLEAAAVPLGRAMFSPRFFASRLQLLAGESMWGGTARTRKIVAKEYARALIGLGVYYTAIQLAFQSDDPKKDPVIGTDPRSSDFGKVRIGNSRLDPLAGLSQVITFGARTATGEKTNAKGKVTPIRGDDIPYGGDKWSDIATNFARSKLHPVPGAIINLFDGTDLAGNKADITNQALNLSGPITYMDVYEVLLEQDLPPGVALSLLTLLGEGLQTYDPKKKRNQKKAITLPYEPVIPYAIPESEE